MIHTVSRAIEFDYAHRLYDETSSCRFLHGHRGKAIVTLSTLALDKMGMVIDFKVIKQRVQNFILEFWDHNCILEQADPLAKLLKDNDINYGKDPYLLGGKPTAENMAEELFRICRDNLFKDIPQLTVEKVKIFETPSCCSTFRQ